MSENDEKRDPFFEDYKFSKKKEITQKIKMIYEYGVRCGRDAHEKFINYVVKKYFGGIDPRTSKTTYKFNTHAVVKTMHEINPIINGRFQINLIMRSIYEILGTDFQARGAHNVLCMYKRGHDIHGLDEEFKHELEESVNITDDINNESSDITKDIFNAALCHTGNFTDIGSKREEFYRQLDAHGAALATAFKTTIDTFVAIDDFVENAPTIGGKIQELDCNIASSSGFILNDCYYLIKTSRGKIQNVEIECIFQLLGYVALMKYTNNEFREHKITKIGIINPYRGTRDVYDISGFTDEHFMNLLKIFTDLA